MKAAASRAKKKAHQGRQAPAKAGFLTLPDNRKAFVLGLLLAVATIAVYFPVRHHPFVNFDDQAYVVDNLHIKSGLDWETISWAFTTFYQFNWHPLTWLSHALDVQMFELEPGGHHDTNLALHVVNVLVLFWVLRTATGYVGRSAMVAGLFALHPINVESVAWIAERKNLLSMLFFLLALRAYGWYLQGPLGKVGRYTTMALLFALGLMAKPQVITFPLALLLWDWWPLRRMAGAGPDISSPTLSAPQLPPRSFLWLVKEKLPLFVIAAASGVITVIAQRSGGAVASLERYGPFVRLATAIVAYAQYVRQAVWPTRLAPFYPHPWAPMPPLPAWQILAALLFLLAISALVVAARSRRYLLMGWLWFLGTMFPMIGLVQVGKQAMADRYAYLPFIGLFLMISWGMADWAQRWRPVARLLPYASVAVLLALALLSRRQLGYWNDNVTLWSHTLQVTSNNPIAEDNLAQVLMDQGQPEEAMKHYRAALAIYPADPDSNLFIAQYDHQHGNLREAIERYDKMLSVTPDSVKKAVLFSNRGYVYRDLGDYAHARESFEAALALNPRNYRTWIGLGLVQQKTGDLGPSIQAYIQANQVHPSDIGYLLLARALEQSGRKQEADAAVQQASVISQNLDAARAVADGLLAH